MINLFKQWYAENRRDIPFYVMILGVLAVAGWLLCWTVVVEESSDQQFRTFIQNNRNIKNEPVTNVVANESTNTSVKGSGGGLLFYAGSASGASTKGLKIKLIEYSKQGKTHTLKLTNPSNDDSHGYQTHGEIRFLPRDAKPTVSVKLHENKDKTEASRYIVLKVPRDYSFSQSIN